MRPAFDPSTESDSTRLLKRQAWMLFTDLNTRFNVLLEECGHLQDMIWSMLGNLKRLPDMDSDPTAALQRIIDFKNENENEDWNQIPWSLLPARQRALRSLYDYLGSLYVGIQHNRDTCREEFELLCRSWTPARFFWFSAQRALFVGRQFGTYTEQLEHAQFKLIQIAENNPGTLPQPTLLRRWNATLFGDFLSGYSRHVDWETQMLAHFEHGLGGSSQHSAEDLKRNRKHEYLIHAWAPVATSRVRSHHVTDQNTSIKPSKASRPRDVGDTDDAHTPTPDTARSWRFRSIKSAFFYLEMPLLFPLLYHECAHAHLDDGDVQLGFFGARNQLTEVLHQAATKELHLSQNYANWHALTGEIWADLIAVTLCGVGYVAALAMQLFGHTGPVLFETEDIGIDELGAARHRIWDVPAFRDEQVFWEVRLRIALAACNLLHDDELDPDMRDWLRGLSAAIDAYHDGGVAVFDFSVQHRKHWQYRRACSEAIVEAAMDVFQSDIFPKLRKYCSRDTITTAYRLPESVGTLIRNAVDHLYQAVFGEPPHPAPSAVAMTVRIEEISLRAKWCYARGAVRKLDSLGSDEKLITNLTRTYVDRIRNDGSGAFRIAMEWLFARFSAIDTIADAIIGRPVNGFKPWMESILDTEHWARIEQQLCQPPHGNRAQPEQDWSMADRTLLAAWLKLHEDATGARYQRWPKRLSRLLKELDQPKLFAALKQWLDESVSSPLSSGGEVGEALTREPSKPTERPVAAASSPDQAGTGVSPEPWFRVARLGTISLGVVWPSFIASRDTAGPFAVALLKVKDAYCESRAARKINDDIQTMRKAFGSSSHFEIPDPCFVPLLGEYSFLLYREHVTPVEPQHEVPARVQALLKPRGVLQLYGGCEDLLCARGREHCAAIACAHPDKREVISVSLIEFAYRWQAFDLRRKLAEQAEQFPGAKLFLSSGWETCILILWHRAAEDFWKVFWNGPLDLGGSCEHVQSYFGMRPRRFEAIRRSAKPVAPGNAESAETDDNGKVPIREFPLSDKLLGRFFAGLAECSGREDFRVRWKADSVDDMFRCLSELPPAFWQRPRR
jgi:hypothetical protein